MQMTSRHRRIRRHIENLGSSDMRVVARAERYLVKTYGALAIDELIAATGGESRDLRLQAGWVLWKIGCERAFEPILRLTFDPDGYVRYDAAMALGYLGDERGIPRLVELLSTPDPDDSVDSAAAMALVRLGSAAIPHVMSLLHSSESTARCFALSVLGGIGGREEVAPIARMLDDAIPVVRTAAVEGLAEIGVAECVPLIQWMTNDPSSMVRASAEFALVELAGRTQDTILNGLRSTTFRPAGPSQLGRQTRRSS